ncbi:MAG: glycosyltransferase family 39 protein [bacterium]|nr:glycosyltransferase family 39 protein [bacterium]
MIDFLRRKATLIAALLLVGMLAIMMTSAAQKSQIIDEAPHIVAGYSYLRTGDFRLNPEHPPLIKMLAGAPLLFMNLPSLEENPYWESGEQWAAGQYFLYRSGADHNWLLFWGRLSIMLLSILLGWLIFKWTKSLFGPIAGLTAVFFYALDPTVTAHSRFITTDIGIALFLFAALYALQRFIQKPTLTRAIVFSAVFALAQLAKFSAVILIPLSLLYLLIAHWQGLNKRADNLTGKVSYKQLFWLTLAVSAISIWAVYGFQFEPLYSNPDVAANFSAGKSAQQFDSLLLRLTNVLTDTETTIGRLAENFARRVPIPALSYFVGFGTLANHNFWGHMAYLMGQYSNVGWWYYFIVAWLVKTPVVTILAAGYFAWWAAGRFFSHWKEAIRERRSEAVTFWSAIKEGIRAKIAVLRQVPLHWYILTLTPLLYFAWTLTSKLNLGVRHLLPVYPFLFILIGSLVLRGPKRNAIAWRIMILAFLVYYAISSLVIYPNYLAYFNEAIGGPERGHRYLTDSNIDWGQDLIALKKYLDGRNISFVYLHYFGTADPQAYGIEHVSPPTNDQIQEGDFKGVVAISVSGLFAQEKNYRWLLQYKPVAKIGHSIWVYEFK